MLQIGDRAPEFSLIDQDKQSVSLSSFKGQNVLLLFFPAAFSATCTEELCSVRDDLGRYSALDVQPIGISVDLPFTLARYREEQRLPFPLLSDFNKEVSRAYGALYEEWIWGLKGVSKRAVFVIDRDGIVRYSEILEDAREVPDFNKVKAALEELATA